MEAKKSVQNWLIRSINDPIVKILSESSNLTRKQMESLLIDFLAINLTGKFLKNEEKAKLRLSKAEISRGAFNRTLKQARKNVIQSIYTILLLGYLGIFDTIRLDPYLEAAGKLQNYVGAYKDVLNDNQSTEQQLLIINSLRKELENSFKNLSKTNNLSRS